MSLAVRLRHRFPSVQMDMAFEVASPGVTVLFGPSGAGKSTVILAAAGLNRLGKTQLVKQVISADVMTPAAGQGALAIEIRSGDAATRALLKMFDDAAARAATTCERALLTKLGGGCQVPIGAFAEVNGSSIRLSAVVAHPNGTKVLREIREGKGDDPVRVGEEVGEILLRRGADVILEEVYGEGFAVPQQP